MTFDPKLQIWNAASESDREFVLTHLHFVTLAGLGNLLHKLILVGESQWTTLFGFHFPLLKF
jgi:hypothetical protein